VHARLEDEGDVAQAGEVPEDVPELEPVVRGVRFRESTMIPPMEVPCPPMNFVVEWMTTSAPWSNGRNR